MTKGNEGTKARYGNIEKWDNGAIWQRHTYARAMLIAVSRVNRRRPLARENSERHREERACRPVCRHR